MTKDNKEQNKMLSKILSLKLEVISKEKSLGQYAKGEIPVEEFMISSWKASEEEYKERVHKLLTELTPSSYRLSGSWVIRKIKEELGL